MGIKELILRKEERSLSSIGHFSSKIYTNNPSIILADEPTGALDSKTSAAVMEMLKDINREGMTVFVITHEEDIAEQTDRIVRLKDGVIISDEKVNKSVNV